MKIHREQLYEQLRLNTLPEVYYQVNEAINCPTSDINDIASLVSEDPALCARLLRIANSAMFNFPTPIDTISQAVTVIGTQQLRDLTLACNLGNLFPGIPPHIVNMEQFWRHSIGAGICARTIASMRRENNVEKFYLMGLLHDLGRLAIYSLLPEFSAKVLNDVSGQSRLCLEIVDEPGEVDHAEISAILLEHWQLPALLSEPIRYHHRPARSASYPEYAAIIHLADILAHAMQLGSSGCALVPPLSPQAWERIGLQIDHLDTIFERVEEQYEDAVNVFLPSSTQ